MRNLSRCFSTAFSENIDLNLLSTTVKLPLKFRGDLPRCVEIHSFENRFMKSDHTDILSRIKNGHFNIVLIDISEEEVFDIMQGNDLSWAISIDPNAVKSVVSACDQSQTPFFLTGHAHQSFTNNLLRSSYATRNTDELYDEIVKFKFQPLKMNILHEKLENICPPDAYQRMTKDRALTFTLRCQSLLTSASVPSGRKALIIPHPFCAPYVIDLLTTAHANAPVEKNQGEDWFISLSEDDKKSLWTSPRPVKKKFGRAVLGALVGSALLSIVYGIYVTVGNNLYTKDATEISATSGIQIDIFRNDEKIKMAKSNEPTTVF